MWKQLFSEAPPGAYENLLSPRRKALYAFFALVPGTTLGLYLHSVKRQMERDNERLRLEQVNEELHEEHAREQKDAVLMGMIQEMRERLRVLEEQAVARRQADAQAKTNGDEEKPAATVADAPATRTGDKQPTESMTSFWDQQKKALLTAIQPPGDAASVPVGDAREAEAASGRAPSRPSGINDRVKMRQQEQLKKDVKAFKAAAQTAPDASETATSTRP